MKDQSMATNQEKTIVTKDEFLKINEQAAYEMSLDKGLQSKALEVLVEADRHRWIRYNGKPKAFGALRE